MTHYKTCDCDDDYTSIDDWSLLDNDKRLEIVFYCDWCGKYWDQVFLTEKNG